MKELRSASQIVFGFLPHQTVDLRGGVWKVKDWRTPRVRSEIDIGSLRREVLKAAGPWRFANLDGGYCNQLEANAKLSVITLDEENGVEVEPFPKTWICKSCQRIFDAPDSPCQCGATMEKGQLHFVGYHDRCGTLRAPFIRRCPTHNQVRVRFPGTASGAEIKFTCPICNLEIQRGFGFPACSCGNGTLTFNVHRAASVYTPRSVVIVNPPYREKIKLIAEAGGPPKAFSWVIEGMNQRTLDDAPSTKESLRRSLLSQGLDPQIVEQMVSISGIAETGPEARVPDEVRPEAEGQAVSIALAMTEARSTTFDLVNGTSASSEIGMTYRVQYPASMELAGVHSVDLVDKFPVLNGHYGYTRGGFDPGSSMLMPFRGQRSEGYRVYAELGVTEAFFIRLDPQRVAKWLAGEGYTLNEWADDRTARLAIIAACRDYASLGNGQRSPSNSLLSLIHSFSHRLLRITAVFSGVERNSLSELLVPLHLGIFIYAASKGDFVLGGLQSVFEGELHHLLDAMVYEEHRCALDPGCSDSGGACVACLHIGEPSCRYFNRHLTRDALFGSNGYLVRR